MKEQTTLPLDDVVLLLKETILMVDMVVLPFVGANVVSHKVDVLPFEVKVQVVYNAVLSFAGLPCLCEEDVQM